MIRRENNTNNATNNPGLIHLCTGARTHESLRLANEKLGLHFDAQCIIQVDKPLRPTKCSRSRFIITKHLGLTQFL